VRDGASTAYLPNWDDDASDLHEERMAAVMQALLRAGAKSVLDLGCGTGVLLERLARLCAFTRLAGVDSSMEALGAAQRRLSRDGVLLHHGSFEVADERLAGYEAVVMLETIEHVDPGRLSAVEQALFTCYRPATVLITTPNREYNALYGMPEDARRHPDHRFEWTRARFRSWAARTAARRGYAVSLCTLGTPDPVRGGPTQMAEFRRGA
jgi:3' terminal RNA ribose 2'-O-methyltransferase Hen1